MRRSASRRPFLPLAGILTALTLLLASSSAHAWGHDPVVNTPFTTSPGSQGGPATCSDGAGGVYVAWHDDRGTDYDLYLTHLTRTGAVAPGWPASGLAVCTAADWQLFPVVTPDGSGGVFLAWQDRRSGGWDVYAQRITSSAAVAAGWPANGLAIGTWAALGDRDETQPRIVGDGTGGFYAVWTLTYTSPTDLDLYGSHVLGNGTIAPGWSAVGRAIAAPGGIQDAPELCSDGAGGAFVAYEDNGSGTYDLRLTRLYAGGTIATPVFADNRASDQRLPRVLPDGAGGVYICYSSDGLTLSLTRYTAALLPASGWSTIQLATYVTGGPVAVSLAPDASGGVYASWLHFTGSFYYEGWIQHVLPSGSLATGWGSFGTPLENSLSPYSAEGIALLADGSGGVIATYTAGGPLLAVRRLANGSVAPGWTSSGNFVTNASGGAYSPSILTDGSGGALVFWSNYTGSQYIGNAARIEHFGRLGDPEPALAGVKDVLNDQGGKVRVSWAPSYLDSDPGYGIYDYVLFRQAPAAAATAALRSGDAIAISAEQAADDVRAARASGVAPAAGATRRILARPEGAMVTYWEEVGSAFANALPGYSAVTATTGDSLGGSNPRTLFMVEAVSYGTGQWFSAPDSGYSVDNLPPVAPAPFTGTYVKGTGTLLAWTPNAEADLAGYRLYRGTTAGFVPGPGNLVAQVTGAANFTDPSPLVGWYKLSAYDIHGNESGFTSLVATGTAGVDDAAPHALAFALGSANPVRGTAALRLALPAAAHVRVSVYDAAGRVVRTLADGERAAGTWTLVWDGANDAGRAAASGLYFARLDLAGRQLVQRIVLAH